MSRLIKVLNAIDLANSADPSVEDGQPAALVYGLRMTAELDRWVAGPGELLQIAARGQHVERWLLPRSAYPDGKDGYLTWRREQLRRHAARIGEFMSREGYTAADIDRIGVLLRKEGIKRDADVQTLEDVICFTFIRWYLGPFATGRDGESLTRIIEKTARKMSAKARAQVLVDFDLPEEFSAAFRD